VALALLWAGAATADGWRDFLRQVDARAADVVAAGGDAESAAGEVVAVAAAMAIVAVRRLLRRRALL
jgi:hypothetical protein